MNVIVAIPCYNCALQLPRVLDGVDARLMKRVSEFWVIDNGSRDDTLQQALNYQKTGRIAHLRIFRNDQNVNLGGTHKIAFQKAREMGATHVAILHGDDQATTSELHDLLDAAESRGGSVLGSRFNRRSRLEGYDRKRILGNQVLNVAYSLIARRRLEDLGSGINLFELRGLDRNTYRGFASSMTFNFELILDLVRRGSPFSFVPITWKESDQVSNARNVSIFVTALRVLGNWRLGRPTSPRTGHTGESTWTELGGTS